MPRQKGQHWEIVPKRRSAKNVNYLAWREGAWEGPRLQPSGTFCLFYLALPIVHQRFCLLQTQVTSSDSLLKLFHLHPDHTSNSSPGQFPRRFPRPAKGTRHRLTCN